MPSQLLASVGCVLIKLWAFEGNDHADVIDCIEAFVDCTLRCTLPQAAKLASSRLIGRVLDHYDRERGISQGLHPLLRRHHHEQMLDILLRQGNVACIRSNKLCVALNRRRLCAIAMGGSLELLQWVLGWWARADPTEATNVLARFDASIWRDVAYRAILWHGHLELPRWVMELTLCGDEELRMLYAWCAAKAGDLEAVKWVTTWSQGEAITETLINDAAKSGNVEMVRYVHDHTAPSRRGPRWGSKALGWAIASGCDEMATYLRDVAGIDHSARDIIIAACRFDRLDVLQQWGNVDVTLPDQLDAGAQSRTLEAAARRGHLRILQWAHRRHDLFESKSWWRVVDEAATHGHLPIIQWAHERLRHGWWGGAMDRAAENNHLEIVQFLHAHRSDACTTSVMDGAAGRGHLEVVQWLHANRTDGCTTEAMDYAAKRGHFETLQWLHEHRSEGCTTKAMKWAALYGHMEIVQWLHTHRTEGCTAEAMDAAARNGHLDVMMWLREHRNVQCTPDTMRICTFVAVVEWVLEHFPQVWTVEGVTRAAEECDLRLLQCLERHRPATATIGEFVRTAKARCRSRDVLLWLHDTYPEAFVSASDYGEISEARTAAWRPAQEAAGGGAPMYNSPMLASVDCVLTKVWPFETSHVDVLRLVDRFLDCTLRFTLPQAARLGSSRLVGRVLDHYDHERGISHGMDPLLRKHHREQAVNVLLGQGNIPCIKEHGVFVALNRERLLTIAEGGSLELLQWVIGWSGSDKDANVLARFGVELWREVAICAIHTHHFGLAGWVIEKTECADGDLLTTYARRAANAGNPEALKWITTRSRGEAITETLIDDATKGGNLEVVRFVCSHTDRSHRGPQWGWKALGWAMASSHDEIARYLREEAGVEGYTRELIAASRFGRLDLLRAWNIEASSATSLTRIVKAAARGGHLRVLQWFNTQEFVSHTHWRCAMSVAAECGHFAIIRWAHENLTSGWSTAVMDSAAANNHLDIVQFLHTNRSEGCTTRAMDRAAEYGHLEMVQWLHANRYEGCTTAAMDGAAFYGHFEIMQWLHLNRTEGWTTDAIDNAADDGHLEIVMWLRSHRQGGSALKAIEYCNFEVVVEWILVHYPHLWTMDIVARAAVKCDLRLLECLDRHRPATVTIDAFVRTAKPGAARNGTRDVLLWLHRTYPAAFAAATDYGECDARTAAWLQKLGTEIDSGPSA